MFAKLWTAFLRLRSVTLVDGPEGRGEAIDGIRGLRQAKRTEFELIGHCLDCQVLTFAGVLWLPATRKVSLCPDCGPPNLVIARYDPPSLFAAASRLLSSYPLHEKSREVGRWSR